MSLRERCTESNYGRPLKRYQGEELKEAMAQVLLGNQQLTATVSVLKVFPQAEVEMRATAEGAVAASQDTIFIGLHFNRLEVTQVRITK